MSDWAQEKLLSFSALNINTEFRMDVSVREKYKKKQVEEYQYDDKFVPFETIVNKLNQLDEIESPMVKLEHIYKCCTGEI